MNNLDGRLRWIGFRASHIPLVKEFGEALFAIAIIVQTVIYVGMFEYNTAEIEPLGADVL
jgi:hypothetical protein